MLRREFIFNLSGLMLNLYRPQSDIGSLVLRKKTDLISEDDTLFHILKTFAIKNKICIGVNGINLSTETSVLDETMSFSFRQQEIQDIFNKVFDSNSTHHWIYRDSSIYIFPDGLSNSILEAKIETFSVNEVNRQEIKDRLLQIREVKNELDILGLSIGDSFDTKKTINDKTKVTLSLYRVTLREILNEIAKKNGTYFWAIVSVARQVHILI
jgi:type II secretory pathway component GspD/PulD (secretin)